MLGHNIAAQESITLAFDGGMASEHEIDATLLANSILAFANLTERTNTFLNGKNSLLSTKVKGSFKEGSFEVDFLIHYLGAIVPIVPQVMDYIKSVIELKKFLNGEQPKRVERSGQIVNVENNQGNTLVVNNTIYTMNTHAPINIEFGKLFKPFDHGIERMALVNENTNKTTITSDQKQFFLPPGETPPQQITTQCQLEVLTPNVDGKAAGWRFYDPENSVEFQAHIADEQFLEAVRDKRYSFQSGDIVTVMLTEVKKMVSQRKRTERIVNQVLDYERPSIM